MSLTTNTASIWVEPNPALDNQASIGYASSGSTITINNPYTLVNPAKRTITIAPQSHGYLVTIGCQTFAVDCRLKMMRYIRKYLKNPTEMEERWMTGEITLD